MFSISACKSSGRWATAAPPDGSETMHRPGTISHIASPQQQARVGIAEIDKGLRGEVIRLVASKLLQRFANREPKLQFAIELDAEILGPGIVYAPIGSEDAAPAAL